MTETSLYRHYDVDGVLLYVGISLSVVARLQKHVRGSRWSRHIKRIEIEYFATREEAMRAEVAAIAREKPYFNIAEVPEYQDPPCRLSGRLTDETIRLAWRGSHADGRGLFLAVRKGDRREWIANYQLAGVRYSINLGEWPRVSIDAARGRALKVRTMADDGIDPHGADLPWQRPVYPSAVNPAA